MTTSFINRIILIAVLTFSFAANGMAKEPSLMDYNGIEYFTWNIDDNGTLHITPLADVTPDFQESPFIKYRKQITRIVFEEDFYNETTLSKIGKNLFMESLDIEPSVGSGNLQRFFTVRDDGARFARRCCDLFLCFVNLDGLPIQRCP